ncbi:hypothetical protein [Thomasclavelia spiroformis]|uniref:hypothetical protein n=1 Tax=Thomasclavelia spiroformis TaxID=29348 RepID=UPI00267474E7|nr:hypothetical protein [Thomasclavelia spiroformis]
MEIVKNNNILILKENNITIEEYDFNNEINFSKLMEYLLEKNLKDKVHFDPNLDEFEEVDINLIGIIRDVIYDYNNKVDEFNKFVSDYSKE